MSTRPRHRCRRRGRRRGDPRARDGRARRRRRRPRSARRRASPRRRRRRARPSRPTRVRRRTSLDVGDASTSTRSSARSPRRWLALAAVAGRSRGRRRARSGCSPADAVETCIDKSAFAAAVDAAAGLPDPDARRSATARRRPRPVDRQAALRARLARRPLSSTTPDELAVACRRHARPDRADPLHRPRVHRRRRSSTATAPSPAASRAGGSRRRPASARRARRSRTPRGRRARRARTVDALGLRAPCNLQGFVDDDGETSARRGEPAVLGRAPASLAAGADLVGEFLRGTLRSADPAASASRPRPACTMTRHFAEVFIDADAVPGARMMRCLVPFGTRPEIVKLAPVVAALRAAGARRRDRSRPGQHDDPRLADDFFADLALEPDVRHDAAVGDEADRVGALLDARLRRRRARTTPDVVLRARRHQHRPRVRARGSPASACRSCTSRPGCARSTRGRSKRCNRARRAPRPRRSTSRPPSSPRAFLRDEGVDRRAHRGRRQPDHRRAPPPRPAPPRPADARAASS